MIPLEEDLVAIRRIADEWRKGWITGDTEAILSLFAEDPVLMPQNQPAVTGKNAIRFLYESVFREYFIQGGGEIVEIVASGDWGYFWSTYTLTATCKTGGEPIMDRGKSIFIVKRQADRSWRISRLITNSDEAPTENPT